LLVKFDLNEEQLRAPGPAIGMFELFGRTGPPILGAAFLDAKNLRRKINSFLTLYNAVDSVVHCC